MKRLISKRLVAVIIFILSFIMLVPVIDVQAGEWDNSIDFYNKYGSNNLVYRSDNATIYYATRGQLGSSSSGILFRPLGYTITISADGKTYSRKMLTGGSVIKRVHTVDSGGYGYTLFGISYKDIVNNFNAQMGGDLKTGKKDITIKFDAVITLVKNTVVQGGLYDDGTTWGTVYTTLAGIRGAASWGTATYNSLASYYGISKTITQAQIKALDTSAPSASYSPSSRGWGSGGLSVTVSVADEFSGIASWKTRVSSDNGSTWSAYTDRSGTSATISLSGTGRWKIQTYVVDNAGHTNSINSGTYYIDGGAPSLSLSASTTAWTKDNVTITVNASDGDSGLKQVSKPDGTTTTSGSFTYTATANGTYSFTATDNVGRTTTKSITVSNIDKASPGLSFSQSPGALLYYNNESKTGSNEFLMYADTAPIFNSNGLIPYVISFEIKTAVAGRVQVYQQNGTGAKYGFYAGVDTTTSFARKSVVVTPTLQDASLTQSMLAFYGTYGTGAIPTVRNVQIQKLTGYWTNGNVTITATGSDSSSGVNTIKKPDGTSVTATSTTYSATSNGEQTFTVTDKAGNSLSKTLYVGNIDKTAPTITLSASTTAWTKGDVTITANASDSASGVASITKPDGTSVNGSSTTYVVSANGTYTFKSKDSLGNESSKSITISNIDKTAPTGSFSPNEKSWTNQTVDVTMTAGDSGSGVKERKHRYSSDNGATWSAYVVGSSPASGVLSLQDAGLRKIEMVVTDNAGNSKTFTSGTYYIDKTVPSLSLSSSTTSWTKGNVTITATGSDAQSGVKRIQKPDGNWITTTGSTTYEATSNGTQSFIVEDNAGNTTTKSITVSNIDKTAPTITLTPSTTAWTKGDVTVTASATDNGSGVSNITKPDGTVVTGSSTTFTVTENGTYTVKSKDAVGNEATKTITISKIDKTLPTGSFSPNSITWTKESVSVTMTAGDSGSGVKERKHRYSSDNGATWSDYVIGSSPASGVLDLTTEGLRKIEMVVTDNVGNTKTFSSGVYQIDKSAPSLTLTQSPTTKTNGNVTITATGSDSLSGVKRIQTPDGNWVATTGSATYQVSSNGTYNFVVEDNVGNTTTKSIAVSNIDKTAPNLTLTASTTSWTNGNVVITVASSDSESGIKNVKNPDNSLNTSTSYTYTISANGTYSFVVTDGAGNTTTKSISVSNIDKTAPGLTLSQSPTANTSGNVVITATGSDSGSGVKRILLPSGSWVTTSNSTTYTVTQNGSYSFTVEDASGNQYRKSIAIGNIDKTAPVLTLSANTTAWTNGNVTITAGATDNLSGVASIELPNGTVVNGSSTTYVVSASGTYTFKSTDSVGNVSSKSITITNIDKTNPTATLTADTTAWTKNDVTITFDATDSQSGVKQVKHPNGTIVTVAKGSYTVKANGNYVFEITDVAGNVTTKSITVSNIDKTAPVINLSLDKTAWTNGNVVINVSSSDANSGVKEITKPDGTKVTTATFAYTVSANGTYNFQVTDVAGNSTTKSIAVNNIDKTAPVLTLTQSPTTFTAGKVTITASGTDANSGVKRIKKPDGSWVNGSSTTFETAENGKFSFVLEDNAGNTQTKEIQISNIDLTAPVATITPSTTGWTNGSITLSISATDNLSGVATIEKPDGAVVNASSTTYVVSANGTFSFKIKDAVGNVSTKSITISNIDKVAPTLSFSLNPSGWTNGNVTITANGSDSDSKVKQIKLPNGSVVSGATASYSVTASGNYSFEIMDNAGNVRAVSASVGNIDKTVPTATITQNPTSWTNGGVTLSVSAQDSESKISYIEKPDGTKIYGDSTTYVVTQNGSFVFKIVDNAGNYITKNISVSNIDKVVPVVTVTQNPTSWTNGSVVLTGSATDNASSIKSIIKPDGNSVSGSNATFTVTENGNYEFRAVDGAGNIGSKSITVSNIDKVAPALSLSVNTTSWIKGSVIITAQGTDSLSGVKEIKLPNGSVVTGSSTTYTVASNGNYTFEVRDMANNVYSKSITVSNIDVTAPEVTLTPSTTAYTKDSVSITLNTSDSQSGVKEIKLPNGTIVQGSTTAYTVTANGTYSFEVVDKVGNKTTKSISIGNIDKVAPVLTLSLASDRITNQTVTINAVGYDALSGVKSIKLPNGNVVSGANASYTVSANGRYTFEIEDKVGNKSTSTIEITNIITINPVSGIQRIEYKLEGATNKDWTAYAGQFNVEAEGITTIRARAIDKAGNVSDEAISFVKIDRSRPINGTVEIIVR